MSQTKSPPNVRAVDRAINGVVTSPWLWGMVTAFAFYAVLPLLPISQESIARCFTAHAIEYVATGLFFVGIAALVMKAARIPKEQSAISANLLSRLKLDSRLNATETAHEIGLHLDSVATACEDTLVVRRVRDAIHHVSSQSADSLESHLHYLSKTASGRQLESGALVRTIIWSLPILGLLGTVIAIATIVPAQPTISDMIANVAFAFDSTASALALSMILVLATFIVSKVEQQILDDVEDVCIKQLACLFPATSESEETFVAALEQASRTIAQQVAHSQVALFEQQERSVTLIAETWRAFHADLTAARDAQTLAMTRLTDSLTAATMGWSDRLEDATRAMNDQIRELRVQGSTLLKIREQEAELLRLKEQLAQNLDSAKVVESIEETLLKLNAAVSQMTTRGNSKAA